MEKEIGQIKFTETDDGFRVEVKGKTLKEALSCCGVPAFGIGKMVRMECCPVDGGKSEECCPAEKK